MKFNLVILGAGAAAMAAASKASELGASVAVIEQKQIIGGTCVNVGCVPTKHLLRAGEIFYYTKNTNFSSISGQESLKFNLKKAIEEKRQLVSSLRQSKYDQVLANLKNVTLFKGKAHFLSPFEVKVEGQTVAVIKGEKFLIATGSSPAIPPIEGLNNIKYLTNVEALELETLPKSLIVLGGGPLGLEFAQMFAHFGSKVCVVQRNKQLLPRVEPEIAAAIKEYLNAEGIDICVGADARKISEQNGEKVLTVNVNGQTKQYRGEEILIATGRKPNTKNLGLEELGVQVDAKGAIVINEYQQTSLPHIYAAGDCRGEPMLETTAAKEGTIVAENALNGAQRKMDYYTVPSCIFTHPQIAFVGYTDAQAVAKGYKCSCRVLDLTQIPKAQIIKDTKGLIKMVADADSGRILGVSICAPDAGDLIHEATLAVKFKLTINDIIDTVHVFPTMSEAIKLVAQSYYKDISQMPCCTD